MIRLVVLLLCSIFAFNSYAVTGDDSTNKKAPLDHGFEHPDHVPHDSHGKNPIKKVSHDDGLLPRKRKKLRVA